MKCFLCSEDYGQFTLTVCCNKSIHILCNGIIRVNLKACPKCCSLVEIPLSKHVRTDFEERVIKILRNYLYKMNINCQLEDQNSLEEICAAIDKITKRRNDYSDEEECIVTEIAREASEKYEGTKKLIEEMPYHCKDMTKEELIAKLERNKKKQHLLRVENEYLGTIVLL